MAPRIKRIDTFDDADLSSTLGDKVDAELPETRYTQDIRLTVELGTLSGGSSPTWNADAEVDILDAVKLNVNGEIWDVPGEFIEYVNTYKDGFNKQDQHVIDLRVPFNGQWDGMVRGKDWSTAKVQLELDKLGNLTSGSPTSQSGTTIKVTGRQTTKGRTNALMSITDSVENLPSGDFQFDLRETGMVTQLLLDEDGATLDEIQMEVYTDDGEVEIIDIDATELRRKNLKEAGTSSLPSGYFLINVGNVDFSANDVEFVRISGTTTASGNVRAYGIGYKEVN